jgi:hypothetical protein
MVGDAVDVAEADVLPGGQVVVQEVLEYDRDPPPELLGVEVSGIGTVPADRTGLGQVQSREKFGERGLAGAVFADQRDNLAGAQVEVDVVERGVCSRRIRERGVVDGDAVERLGRRSCASGSVVRRGGGQERGVVLDEQPGFVHLADAVDRHHDAFAEDEQSTCGGGGLGQSEAVRQREGQQAGDARSQRHGETERAGDGDAEAVAGGAAQFGHVLVVQRRVTCSEVGADAERADFLGGVLGGQQAVEVVAGACDGGHAHVEAEQCLTGLEDRAHQR